MQIPNTLEQIIHLHIVYFKQTTEDEDRQKNERHSTRSQ